MKNMIFTVSSLEKIFPEKTPKLKQKSFSVFQNEKFNFQIAVFLRKNYAVLRFAPKVHWPAGFKFVR